MSFPARRIFRFLQIGFKKKTWWVFSRVGQRSGSLWDLVQDPTQHSAILQAAKNPSSISPHGLYDSPVVSWNNAIDVVSKSLRIKDIGWYRIVGQYEITLWIRMNSFPYIYRQSWQSLSMFVECLPMCWNLNSSIQDYRTSSLCLDLLIPLLTISKHGWNSWYHPNLAVRYQSRRHIAAGRRVSVFKTCVA